MNEKTANDGTSKEDRNTKERIVTKTEDRTMPESQTMNRKTATDGISKEGRNNTEDRIVTKTEGSTMHESRTMTGNRTMNDNAVEAEALMEGLNIENSSATKGNRNMTTGTKEVDGMRRACPFFREELSRRTASRAIRPDRMQPHRPAIKRRWCDHTHSPVTEEAAKRPRLGGRFLACHGDRSRCPLTTEQWNDGIESED